jgi:serine phosphatase RsbU (regulator of sigma subunit)
MRVLQRFRNKFIGKAIAQCADPFEEGRLVVMFNFALVLVLLNIPYTIISYDHFIGHFISSIVQDACLLFVIISVYRASNLTASKHVFFANFIIQHIYHFLLNNGELLLQGMLFFILLGLFAFFLYGRHIGWLTFIFILTLSFIGIYNVNSSYSLFYYPTELADPAVTGDATYIIILPLLMNFYLISEFVRSQIKAQKRISHQNKELAEKNKEITDSINYAQKIQEAILPSLSLFKSRLPDSFVLYLPKDIVAGDFYFLEYFNKRLFLAVADCTGHGVPGAMLSVVCSNSLNRSVKEFGLPAPGPILDKTRDIVIENLTSSEREVQDGMDISFCVMESEHLNLEWSGANNPLWIVRNGELLEFKGDKQPVGRHHKTTAFTTHHIPLQSGDTFYLFTDGFQDQFGGEKEKKYSARRLKQKLRDIQSQTMEEQMTSLKEEFEQWRGYYEQIDDVCIIGVRV